MILAALVILAAQPSASVELEARGLYCPVLLRDDLERRRAMRPYLASTDPTAIGTTDAAIAEDEAALKRFAAISHGSGPDAAAHGAVLARAAKDVSTLQSLQNAEEGCEATACMTQARAARDADPAWARLKDCQAGAR